MPASARVQTEWRSIAELLTCFHPQNPIEHTIEGDVADLALSLLEGGWVEPVTLNVRNNLLVGGHGRVMAAEYLLQQSEAWHQHRWEIWSAVNDAGPTDPDRFTPPYWDKALVLLVDLSEPEHEAMMIRLNDTDCQGKDDPQKLRSLLSSLPGRLKAIAGYPVAEQPVPGPAQVQAEDYQEKQVFERPDATDYRAADAPDPDTAEYASGDVLEYDDPTVIELDHIEELPEPPKAPPPVRALSVSLTWAQWKTWNAWKRELGITKDTDAFVKGHEAYEVKPEEEAIDD